MLILVIFGIYSELIGKQYKRALGRVAHCFAGAVGIEVSVAAQRAAVKQIFVHGAAVLFCKVFGKRRRSHFKICAYGDVRYRHFIQRERTRLVAADDGCAAQRFNRGQTFYKCVLFSHSLNAESHYNGSRCGQTFGYYGNSQRYAQKNERLPRSAAAREAYYHNDDAHDKAYNS